MVPIATGILMDYLDFMLTEAHQANETKKNFGQVTFSKEALSLQSATEPRPLSDLSTIQPLALTHPGVDSYIHQQNSEEKLSYPIIVHCHLRWDGVWQRPQQFLSRLSRRHRILFVEGPQLAEGDFIPKYRLCDVPDYPNITIMQTEFPSSRFHDGSWVDNERYRLLCESLEGPLSGQFETPVQWFYDPMASTPFAGKLNESAVVYDCMDELSQFRFAPPEIIERERCLLSRADVVFTGGRKLYHSKIRFNSNCHFYGCGVEVNHFAKARESKTAIPSDLQSLAKPILGYFGVVDERIDYDLILKLAESDPNWNLAIIGPLAKVDPAALPKHPRIHWLGRREYKDLPAYVKGFDACLMPFALNEATEFINPTKALEYMAGGKQIISSAVPDVISNFSNVVKVARSHEEFVSLCLDAVRQPDKGAIERGIAMANDNQWETIVKKLESHIEDARSKRAIRPLITNTPSSSQNLSLSTA